MPLSSASVGFRPLFAPHTVTGDLSKRNYTGAFNCFARIAREEGYRAFYKVLPSKKSCVNPCSPIAQGLGASYLGVAETAIQVTAPLPPLPPPPPSPAT